MQPITIICTILVFVIIALVIKFFTSRASYLEVQRKLADSNKLMHDIFTLTSAKTGNDLFEHIVKSMTNEFGFRFSIIGRLNKDASITTLAAAMDSNIIDNFTYELHGTPCDKTIKTNTHIVNSNAIKLYPLDTMLADHSLDSYGGTQLYDAKGNYIGIFVVLNTKPIENSEYLENILKTMAIRISSELDRIDYTKTIHDQQLRMTESSRLAALGELAAGIAHEINNPLQVIKSTSDILSHKIKADGYDKVFFTNKINKLSETTDRMKNIVNSLSFLSRKSDPPEFIDTNIILIIQDVLTIVEQKLKDKNIKLNLNKPEGLFNVSCHQVQISQVILNILNNAIYALKDVSDPEINIFTNENDKHKDLIISNNGESIPLEIEAKIMEPFYTTKDVGVGTGLGLSISKANMVNHNGDLLLNQTDDNVSFTLRFYKFNS